MKGKIPLYLELYNKLRIDIENNVYASGEKMPSETDLISMHNASRITVRKAISMLANDGYVSVRQGHGTIVASPTMFNTNCVTSLTEQIRAAGYTPSARHVHLSRSYAPVEITGAKGIPDNSEMICMQRIQYADEQPFGIIVNYIRPDLVPGIEEKKLDFVSLYRYSRSWMDFPGEEFIHELAQYIQWYNAKRIKCSLGGCSPLEYRRSLGIA